MNSIRLNDVGTAFQISAKTQNDGSTIDLTGSTIIILFKKPSGQLITRSPSTVTTYAEYIAVAGDFDERGLWQCQLLIDFGSAEVYSTITTFSVL